MPEYDDELRGVLFKNDKKETDKHPDYKGSAQVRGEEYWLSAWIKTSKKGQKFMSLSFEVKDGRSAPPAAQQQQGPAGVPDDIPF